MARRTRPTGTVRTTRVPLTAEELAAKERVFTTAPTAEETRPTTTLTDAERQAALLAGVNYTATSTPPPSTTPTASAPTTDTPLPDAVLASALTRPVGRPVSSPTSETIPGAQESAAAWEDAAAGITPTPAIPAAKPPVVVEPTKPAEPPKPAEIFKSMLRTGQEVGGAAASFRGQTARKAKGGMADELRIGQASESRAATPRTVGRKKQKDTLGLNIRPGIGLQL